MKAASIDRYGPEQKLRIGQRPEPEAGPGDVLVEIHAASVNPIDFKVRDGKLRFLRPYRFPLILGHDCAGTVVGVGSQVSGFQVGDRIYARPRNGRIGTFAERIAIDASEIALMPSNCSFVQAASLPLVGLTSWQALVGAARLGPGQKVLIQAGSGGVGTFAVQLAKHLGAEVWTTTSTRNVPFVRELGADHVIDYRTERFEERATGMDVVFDTLGGEALDQSFAITKPGGWVVSISGLPDERTARDMELGFWKSLVLRLVGLRLNGRAKKAGVSYRFLFMKPIGAELRTIAGLVEQGALKPVIDRTFPLEEAQTALDLSASGKARGKIVVTLKD